MKFILVGLLIVGFFYLMFKLVLKMARMRYSSDANGESRSAYMVYFPGVKVPHLGENSRLKEVVTIRRSFENGYHILSTLNDTKLKELLVKEYNLKPSNIIIHTVGQLSHLIMDLS